MSGTGGKLALVFPGQGSQVVGMGREMALEYEVAAEVYQAASEQLGWDVAELCFEGPEERLNRTDKAQVALFVNSAAAAAVLNEKGLRGDATSGHSLGEYSALAASGAISFKQGLDLVNRRGQAMQRAAADRPGSMAAIIGLEDRQVEEICDKAGQVWPVNYNCPGQLVISGETDFVYRAMERAAQLGARKTVELKVSGSFHTPLMRGAAGEMKQELAMTDFTEPQPPFLSSISCEYETAAGLADLLVRQMVSPVRWRQAVERLIDDGVDRFIEVGNGKVLSGLVRRINREVVILNVSDPDSLDAAVTREGGMRHEH